MPYLMASYTRKGDRLPQVAPEGQIASGVMVASNAPMRQQMQTYSSSTSMSTALNGATPSNGGNRPSAFAMMSESTGAECSRVCHVIRNLCRTSAVWPGANAASDDGGPAGCRRPAGCGTEWRCLCQAAGPERRLCCRRAANGPRSSHGLEHRRPADGELRLISQKWGSVFCEKRI